MKLIEPKETSRDIINFIKKTFKREKFHQAVIGLSGGIDSAVCCTLAARALGEENIFPLLLPYGEPNSLALEVTDFLGIPKQNVTQKNIKPIVEEIIKTDPQIDFLRKGNIMARVRMILLFDQAKKRKALVIGTENKSEYLLGYFTRFGDEASDIEPIRHLYKTHVYQLARFLNLPESILTKTPSAELWENQTDEEEFGFTYQEADQILFYYFDKRLSLENILAKGFKRQTVIKVLQFLKKNNFKHRTPFVAA